MSLLAMAVGKKQKANVNEMIKKVTDQIHNIILWTKRFNLVEKLSYRYIQLIHFLCCFLQFPLDDFVIMLFHYDGIVDDWKDLEWSSHAIHISAISQTKW